MSNEALIAAITAMGHGARKGEQECAAVVLLSLAGALAYSHEATEALARLALRFTDCLLSDMAEGHRPPSQADSLYYGTPKNYGSVE